MAVFARTTAIAFPIFRVRWQIQIKQNCYGQLHNCKQNTGIFEQSLQILRSIKELYKSGFHMQKKLAEQWLRGHIERFLYFLCHFYIFFKFKNCDSVEFAKRVSQGIPTVKERFSHHRLIVLEYFLLDLNFIGMTFFFIIKDIGNIQ